MDGSPYRVPPSNVIAWKLPPEVYETSIKDLAVTGSRIMMYIYLRGGFQRLAREWRMVIWDWNTGDLVRMPELRLCCAHVVPQVIDRSSADGGGLIGWNFQGAFLDEFRILVVPRSIFPHPFELFVFDTLLPQDHPRHLRRFMLPPKYGHRSVRVYLDHDRPLGTVDRDGPLLVDPTQAILIVDLSRVVRDPRIFLILRMQDLIEHTCSMRTEAQIPWDEWGRGNVVIEIPTGITRLSIVIHGARLLAIYDTHRGSEGDYCIHIFDLCRRASSALTVSDESNDGTERRAPFKTGRSCLFEEGGGVSMWGLQPLGDSVVFYEVSISCLTRGVVD